MGTKSLITHITPADGNVFLDLGFEPEEAAALKAESDHVINNELEQIALTKRESLRLLELIENPPPKNAKLMKLIVKEGMSDTSPYDVVILLRTHEEMVMYLDACIEESGGDTAFITKAIEDIARAHSVRLGTPMSEEFKAQISSRVANLGADLSTLELIFDSGKF